MLYTMWTIWNVREVLRQKKIYKKLGAIIEWNIVFPILLLGFINFFFVRERIWGKEFIVLSVVTICLHGMLTIGSGFCLFHFLHTDLINKKENSFFRKRKKKEEKSYKRKNRDYVIIGIILIIFAIGWEICFMYSQGKASAKNQTVFSITQIDGTNYAVVMTDGEYVILKKCKEENGILKIHGEGSRKENCNGLWITEKQFKGNEIVETEWNE